jgi:hypothetical protein
MENTIFGDGLLPFSPTPPNDLNETFSSSIPSLSESLQQQQQQHTKCLDTSRLDWTETTSTTLSDLGSSLSMPSSAAAATTVSSIINRGPIRAEPEAPLPSCVICHKQKVKCRGGRPCERCIKQGRAELCENRPNRQRGRPKNKRNDHTSTTTHTTTTNVIVDMSNQLISSTPQTDFSIVDGVTMATIVDAAIVPSLACRVAFGHTYLDDLPDTDTVDAAPLIDAVPSTSLVDAYYEAQAASPDSSDCYTDTSEPSSPPLTSTSISSLPPTTIPPSWSLHSHSSAPNEVAVVSVNKRGRVVNHHTNNVRLDNEVIVDSPTVSFQLSLPSSSSSKPPAAAAYVDVNDTWLKPMVPRSMVFQVDELNLVRTAMNYLLPWIRTIDAAFAPYCHKYVLFVVSKTLS